MKYWNSVRRRSEHTAAREDWTEPIDRWLEWLGAFGRSAETLRTRWYQISRFSRVVDKPIDEVDEDDVVFYFADLSMEGKRGLRSCVKSFYDWGMKHGVVDHNPAAGVPPIPIMIPSGEICPEEDIVRGLASPDRDARLAVMLGAFCGLRRAEMTRIHLDHDLRETPDGLLLRIHGKGNKDRMLPVPDRVALELRGRDGYWAFPGAVDGHCCVDYVGGRIKKATGHPSHTLRRRFATVAYYRTGCNIVLVSRMLGHANVVTTMRYIGLAQNEMRDAVETVTRLDTTTGAPSAPTRAGGHAAYAMDAQPPATRR